MLPPSDVMDPLSDVLALLKPRSHMAGGFDVGEPWSIRFGRHEGVKCYAVVAGVCWLDIEGGDEPTWLKTGDYFILPRGQPFRLASDLGRRRPRRGRSSPRRRTAACGASTAAAIA